MRGWYCSDENLKHTFTSYLLQQGLLLLHSSLITTIICNAGGLCYICVWLAITQTGGLAPSMVARLATGNYVMRCSEHLRYLPFHSGHRGESVDGSAPSDSILQITHCVFCRLQRVYS